MKTAVYRTIVVSLLLLALCAGLASAATYDYWVEDENTTHIYTRINITAGSNTTIYITDSGSTYAENPSAIFHCFDDFEGSLTSNWTVESGAATSVTGGYLDVYRSGSNDNKAVYRDCSDLGHGSEVKWVGTTSGTSGNKYTQVWSDDSNERMILNYAGDNLQYLDGSSWTNAWSGNWTAGDKFTYTIRPEASSWNTSINSSAYNGLSFNNNAAAAHRFALLTGETSAGAETNRVYWLAAYDKPDSTVTVECWESLGECNVSGAVTQEVTVMLVMDGLSGDLRLSDTAAPASGVKTYEVVVEDLYDDSALAGVTVAFSPTCSNITDASGSAQVTNVSCAGLSGDLTAVNVSKTGYGFNETAFTVTENGTTNVGAYVAVYNVTAVTEKVTGSTIPTTDGWEVAVVGGKTYENGTNMYFAYGANTLTWSGTGAATADYYAFNTTVTVSSAPSTGTVSINGVYDHKHTFDFDTVNGVDITASTNVTVWNVPLGFSENCTSTTGECVFNLTQGVFYNYSVEPYGYAWKTGNITPSNESATTLTEHYASNTITFNFFDEETGAAINNTLVIEAISDAMSANYSTTNGTLTTDFLSPDTYTLRYVATGYNTHFYIFTVENNYHYTLNLTLLNLSIGSNVTLYVKDTLGNLLEGAVVKVQKYDVTGNDFDTVDILSTNFEGRTQANIILNSEYYKFVIEYGGFTTTTNPSYIYGTELTIYHQLGTSGFEDYFTAQKLSGSVTHSYTTHVSTFAYNDLNNLASEGCVYAYRVTAAGENEVNSSCSSGASGTAYVGVENATGAYYLIKGYVTTGNNTYLVATEGVSYDSTAPESGSGMLFLAFLIMASVFIGFWSLPVAVILGGATPLLVGITGLVTLPLTITVPLFGLSLIIAYLIGGKQ